MCDKGYVGLTWDSVNNAGSTICSKASPIDNCDYAYQVSSSSTVCYACKSDYAVTNNDTECISYSAMSGCRKLQTDNTNCWYCWHSYYWDET